MMFHQQPLTFLERVCVALGERDAVDPAWEAAYAQHGGLKPYRPGFETFDQDLAKRTRAKAERIAQEKRTRPRRGTCLRGGSPSARRWRTRRLATTSLT